MRCPITQVGCFSACSTVMCSNSLSGNCAERAARCGQPDLLHLLPRSRAHALVNRVVLGVDGQQRHVLLTRRAGQDLARRHHAFLIREADRLARHHRGIGRFESRHAHDGGDDEVDLRSVAARTLPSVPETTSMPLIPEERSRTASCCGKLRRRHGSHQRPPARALLEGQVDIAPRSQRGHAKALRITRDNRERAGADRAGRTQDGDVLQNVQRSLSLRPWRHNPVHARVCDQLPHVLIVVNDDPQVHAVDRDRLALDLDLALQVARL